MVSWWETVKVEPINALGVWVVNSSPKDFLKALSLMVSHALSCPVLAACLACYTAEPLGVSYVLEQWSAPLMVDFFCLDQLSVLNKAFPAPYTWICPNLTGKVGRNLLGRKVPLIFNEINHSSLSLSCSLSSAEESLALRSFLWLIQTFSAVEITCSGMGRAIPWIHFSSAMLYCPEAKLAIWC